jgi:GT2 family glycosyltransferase
VKSVAAVVLNWNGLEDTLRCLNSLSATESPLDTIVVDNGSTIDPTRVLTEKFPQIECIRLEKNIGFAAGSNLGARRALERGADFILFLNNDTIASARLLDALISAFDESIGIVSPVIRGMPDSSLIDFAGARINLALGRFKHCVQQPSTHIPFDTDYASGCCMMLSRQVIEQVGLFDEKLFAYFEDVDLCLRARRAGMRVVCVPTATVLHKGSASTRRDLAQGTTSPLKHYLIARNRMVVVARYASPAPKWFHRLVSNPIRVCFYVTGFVARGRWTKLRSFLRGIRDGVDGKLEMPVDLLSTA